MIFVFLENPLFASQYNILYLLKTYKKAKKFEELKSPKAKKYYTELFKVASEILKNQPRNSTIHYILGTCYLNGYGVEKNYKKAFEHFIIAYRLGNRTALCGAFISGLKSGQPLLKMAELYKNLKNLGTIYKKCKEKDNFLKLEKNFEKQLKD